jgi:hypothetical protein
MGRDSLRKACTDRIRLGLAVTNAVKTPQNAFEIIIRHILGRKAQALGDLRP